MCEATRGGCNDLVRGELLQVCVRSLVAFVVPLW